jgi:hypothetical protein
VAAHSRHQAGSAGRWALAGGRNACAGSSGAGLTTNSAIGICSHPRQTPGGRQGLGLDAGGCRYGRARVHWQAGLLMGCCGACPVSLFRPLSSWGHHVIVAGPHVRCRRAWSRSSLCRISATVRAPDWFGGPADGLVIAALDWHYGLSPGRSHLARCGQLFHQAGARRLWVRFCMADVSSGAAELRSHSAGRVHRVRLGQSVEHLAQVIMNPEMPLAVTGDEPCAAQVR